MAEISVEFDPLHRARCLKGSAVGADALLLAAFAEPKKNALCAELGTGSGAVPLLFCLHKSFRRFYAVERLPEEAALARENLAENGFSDRVEVIEGDARRLSLPEPADLVCMNPPYFKAGDSKSPDPLRRAARTEEAGTIAELCLAAAGWLKEKGELCVVYRPERLADLFDALRRARLEPKTLLPVKDRPDSAPSLLLVRAVKGAAAGISIPPAFFWRNEDGSASEDARLLAEGRMRPR